MVGLYLVKYCVADYNLMLWDIRKSKCGGEGVISFEMVILDF
jgi:hypothetical protein